MKKMIFNESINVYVEQPSLNIIGFDKNNDPIFDYTEQEIAEQNLTLVINDIPSKSYTADRYATCLSCENFLKSTKVCKKCFCFIPLKIFFKGASCPIGKWGPIEEKNE
jgi:hypothetical protein